MDLKTELGAKPLYEKPVVNVVETKDGEFTKIPLADAKELGGAKSRDLDKTSILERLQLTRDRNEALAATGQPGVSGQALELLAIVDALELLLGVDTKGPENTGD